MPRVREMNSSIRCFAARCADQSCRRRSSSARVEASATTWPSSSSSSSRDPRARVHAVRDRRDRHLVDGPVGPEACHISRETAPCSSDDAVRVRRRPQRERRQARRRRRRARTFPSSANSSHVNPQRSTRGSTFRRTSSGSKTSLPAGTGVCVVKTVDAAQPLQRLVADRRRPPRRARAAARAGGTPSAPRSCGTPSARARAAAGRARRRRRARAPGEGGSRGRRRRACRWRRAPSPDCPRPSCRGGRATRVRPSRARRRSGPERARRSRLRASTSGAIGTSVSGSRARVVARIALDLAVALVEPLPEVAAAVEEPDRDERDAELRGRLEMVAGEDAEAAGIDGQALVEAELGREVRDEEVVRQRAAPATTSGARASAWSRSCTRPSGPRTRPSARGRGPRRSARRGAPSGCARAPRTLRGASSAKSARAPGVQLNEKLPAISASAARSVAPS